MATDTTTRHSRLEAIGLAALALAPLGLLVLAAFVRTGKDFSVPFCAALVVCLVTGVCLANNGLRLGRSGRVWAGAVTVALVYVSGFLGANGILWYGRKPVLMSVSVRDAETGRPIRGASVRLYDREKGAEVFDGRTDEEGRVQISHRFRAAGYSSPVKWEGELLLSHGGVKRGG